MFLSEATVQNKISANLLGIGSRIIYLRIIVSLRLRKMNLFILFFLQISFILRTPVEKSSQCPGRKVRIMEKIPLLCLSLIICQGKFLRTKCQIQCIVMFYNSLCHQYIKVCRCIQGVSKLCARNVKTGRGDLNKQISYRDVSAEMQP